jgi:hypothetical protein
MVGMMKVFSDELTVWKELVSVIQRLRSTGELGKSEKLLVQAYEQGTRIFGSHHGEVGMVLLMLTEVCEQQGKMQLAAEYNYKAQEIASLYKLDAETPAENGKIRLN